jgi:hypothetical protein
VKLADMTFLKAEISEKVVIALATSQYYGMKVQSKYHLWLEDGVSINQNNVPMDVKY